MPNSWNEILSARAGSIIANDGSPVDLEFYSVTSIDDNTIILYLYQGDEDVTAEYITNPANKIGKGGIITPKNINKPFTSITLDGGAVCITLK